MKGSATLFSSARNDAGRDDWRTPPEVLQLVRDMFGKRIDLDPCADVDPDNHLALRNFSGPNGNGCDGLTLAWSEPSVYINPPYATFKSWALKLLREYEAQTFNQAIMLVPSRTDTVAWHTATTKASAVCFVAGRLRFVGADASAPFPSALIYLGDFPGRFAQAFASLGKTWKPLQAGV